MYIPVCPITESNAEYLARQRQTFLEGFPAPDFPGGQGESEHLGRPTIKYMEQHLGSEGLRAMGLEMLDERISSDMPGARRVVQKANSLLGFA